jgi:hypothetical protein
MIATMIMSTMDRRDKCGQRAENCVSCRGLPEDTISAVTQPL